MKNSNRNLILLLMTLLGIFFFRMAFWPGSMSNDSISQYEQARSLIFDDWHPPLMSLAWHFVDRIIPGQSGMLWSHIFMFWGALGIFAIYFLPGILLPTLFLFCVGFWPPILSIFGVIWKDVAMSSALLLGIALLALAGQKRSRLLWIICLVFLFYGFCTRHNAAPAMLPLYTWAALVYWKIAPKPKQSGGFFSKQRTWIMAVSLFLISFVTITVANHELVRGKSSHPGQQIFLFDLTGISVLSHSNQMPDYILKREHPVTLEVLNSIYQADDNGALIWGDPAIPRPCCTQDPGQMTELKKKWLVTVVTYPIEYLRHRWANFLFVLQWRDHVAEVDFIGAPALNGIQYHPTHWEHPVHQWLMRWKDTVVFRGWFYFILIPMLLAVSYRKTRRFNFPAWALGSSGFLYVLAYAVVGQASGYRYNYWMIFCGVVLPFFILSKPLQSESDSYFQSARQA